MMNIRILVTLLLLAIVTGCKVQNNSNSVSNQNAGQAATPSPETKVVIGRVTLPVLDALLSNDSFNNELKTKLTLTDDQISALKKASSEEVDRLRQMNAEESSGDAAEARRRASDEITGIIGPEKTRQLDELARNFWANGGEATSSTENSELPKTPNSVPTDTRIVINEPAFRMDLFRDGSLVKSYKIGIGYPQFPLPQGLRQAKTIIFNPTWTPPDSPWVANMKKISPGEKIEAGSKLNPLGPAKIPIGLPSLIHGGKSPAKLGEFASHGCVGLTNDQIIDFARLLAEASGTDLSDKEISSYLSDKTQTKAVKLDKPVPVELRYETIVVEEGKLHIYKDVYDQDTNTEENLRAVLEANGTKLEDLSADERAKVMAALNTMSAHPKKTSSELENVSSTSDNSNANENRKGSRKSKSSEPKPEKQKEIVIEIAQLSGRGYPAPVDFDEGKGATDRTVAAASKRK